MRAAVGFTGTRFGGPGGPGLGRCSLGGTISMITRRLGGWAFWEYGRFEVCECMACLRVITLVWGGGYIWDA